MADDNMDNPPTDIKDVQGRIVCPIGHEPKPRMPHPSEPPIETVEKRGIVSALYDLQSRRDNIVQRWAIYDNIRLLHDSLEDDAKAATHFYVGGAPGLLAPRLQLGEVVDKARKTTDAAGNLVAYARPFGEMRDTARYSFWVMPIDKIWILIVFELRADVDDGAAKDNALFVKRPAGQNITARRIGIADVVTDGRAERRQRIENRLRAVLPEADIDIADNAFVTINTPTFNHEIWKTGYVAFGLVQEFVHRINNIMGEGRIDGPPDDIFNDVYMPINDNWIELTRAYLTGALCSRFHRLHNFYSITAIELPGRSSEYDPRNRRLPLSVGAKKRTITVADLKNLETKGSSNAASVLKKRRREKKPDFDNGEA